MKTYNYPELVEELIRKGGYPILDFSWLYDLMGKFRLQPFYAEGEIVEWGDEPVYEGPYAEGEIVCPITGIEVRGNTLVYYGEDE